MPPSCCGFLSQYTHHHLVAFLLTFFSYVFLHASRKTFSNVKVSISAQWTPSPQNASSPAFSPSETWESNRLFETEEQATLFLGALDSIFLFSYAVGLYLSGVIGDRVNLRYVLCFGLCGSAAVGFAFGTLTEWLHLYNIYLYCSLWVLNGLLQSTVWPCVVAVMANWFGKTGSGFVFGLWSACASVGNILGAFLASSMLKYGYEYTFLVTSVVQFAGGVVVFFGLLTSPKEVGLSTACETGLSPVETDTHRPLMSDGEEEEEENEDGAYSRNHSVQQQDEPREESKAVGFFQAFCLPGVLPYSLAYACLKLVNYSFFFWLPFYLSNNYGWKEAEADRLSMWYDVGGIIGGTVQGLITDVLGKRSPVLGLSLALAMASLVGYSHSPNDKAANAALLAITGFFIGGPSNMISSAISADLGRQDAVRGSREALATVTGIVDGTGSIGAAGGQYLVSLIESKLGWLSVFYFFVIMTGGSVVFIAPLILKDVRAMWRERQALHHQL
ncbi:sugar phosphate exchanger 3 [Nerophis ophidion]|uniref:sugar phosphate exchanger 3 n=1 Tax=Nerophis ophidion TaxID=159077 RepID=UPI002AE00F89|nr:sugar phosphate exchanger 3 [Nerophis ophidion]XP_061770507.1 sugar phosphate exchanger 3 [Nerophis ophidion]XP_061770508.1 sugar phosphate exchanger 3 [Nerophis ophidion]XP_061770510.1 sugar phosphate exchanger 3 [Nerophis ophidion]XP_061770511.1 sugar phosphate exchanger 3 [Nerophis ophidion]XP_061770512.1 sugar phosphate exchanger 3 [Nerophis ophidion]